MDINDKLFLVFFLHSCWGREKGSNWINVWHVEVDLERDRMGRDKVFLIKILRLGEEKKEKIKFSEGENFHAQ